MECLCEHSGPVDVSKLIERFGDRATVAQAVEKLRCTQCGARQIKDYRIVYQGGSLGALRGAEQTRQSPK